MYRTIRFSHRNLIEMSRDVLSYIFCIIFPVIMLIVMTMVNSGIPKEAGMTIFNIDNLTGGVIVFGHTFIMLFCAIQLAADRSSSFLIRLYASPLKSRDFLLGYTFAMLIISLLQTAITLTCGLIISLIIHDPLKPAGLLMAFIVSPFSAAFFIALGLIFGALFHEKAAPGVCSLVISLSSFFGSLWFDVKANSGIIYTISRCLPLLYCTMSIRAAIRLELTWEEFFLPLILVTASALIAFGLAIAIFRRKMKADLT